MLQNIDNTITITGATIISAPSCTVSVTGETVDVRAPMCTVTDTITSITYVAIDMSTYSSCSIKTRRCKHMKGQMVDQWCLTRRPKCN